MKYKKSLQNNNYTYNYFELTAKNSYINTTLRIVYERKGNLLYLLNNYKNKINHKQNA